MIRILQLSLLIVILLIGRRIVYGWLKEHDPLPQLLRQGLDVLLAYFAYVTVGLLLLSLVAGWGFGAQVENQATAVVVTLVSAAYVGVGVAGLWLFLGKGR